MTGHWSELELRQSLVRQTTKVKQSSSQSEDGSTELSHPLLEGMVTHDWLFDNPLLYKTTQDERSSCQQYIVYFIFLDTLNQKCHIYIFIYTHYLGLQWGVVASFRGSMYSLGMRLGEWAPPQTLDKVPSTITYRQPGGGLTAISVTSFWSLGMQHNKQ